MTLDLDYDSELALLSAILFYCSYIERKINELTKVGCFGAANRLKKEKESLDNIVLKLVF